MENSRVEQKHDISEYVKFPEGYSTQDKIEALRSVSARAERELEQLKGSKYNAELDMFAAESRLKENEATLIASKLLYAESVAEYVANQEYLASCSTLGDLRSDKEVLEHIKTEEAISIIDENLPELAKAIQQEAKKVEAYRLAYQQSKEFNNCMDEMVKQTGARCITVKAELSRLNEEI